MSIEITSAEGIVRELQAASVRLREASRQALLNAGVQVAEEAKRILAAQLREGDASTLVQSIHLKEMVEDEIAVTAEADHAAFVEFGTHAMPARPFMTPAMQAMQTQLMSGMQTQLAAAL